MLRRDPSYPRYVATITLREAIARAIWLQRFEHAEPEGWPDTWTWLERESAAGHLAIVEQSAIGECVRTADKVLRLLEAAGVEPVVRINGSERYEPLPTPLMG